MDLNDLDDAEKFQKHFVTPMIDAVRDEIHPLIHRLEALELYRSTLEPRVVVLEGYGKKVMALYSAIVGAVTFAAHYAWLKIRSML